MVWKKASVLGLVLFAPSIVSAQVVITEIMYDLAEGGDTGREWVEVQNTGSESVNITEWKLFENDTNHGLKAVGGEVLAPGSYAIISDNPAKFASDWPSYSGLVFDSAFALNNTGETLILRCCGKEPTDRDSVTYNNTGGGNGDGLSLHRSGSTITAASPSPGSGAVQVPAPRPKEPEPAPEPEPSPPPKLQAQPVVQETQQQREAETQTAQANQESKKAAPPAAPTTVVVQEEQEVLPTSQKTKTKVIEASAETEQEGVESVKEQVEEARVPTAQFAAAESAAPSSSSSDMLWWLGAAAVSFFGAGGAYLAGRGQRKRDWKIEEVE